MLRRSIAGALLLAVAAVLLVGCASGPLRSPSPGPDWSRGVQVGESSINEPVAFYAAPDGQRIHLAWSRISPEGDSVEYRQVSAAGVVEREVTLPCAVRSPRRVSLVTDGSDGLIVCYLSGIGAERRLHAAHLSATGEVLAGPEAVSGEELEVDDYSAVAGPAGVELFWSHNGHGKLGLYHVRLDRSGRLLQPSKLIYRGGISPSAQMADDGRVHLAWIHEPDYSEEHVYYAAFDADRRELIDPVELAYFSLGPKATRFGPVLALGQDEVHVAWAWEMLASSAGAAAGEGECQYISFPSGQAAGARPQALNLSPSERLEYEPAQGAFPYTQLAPAAGGSRLVYMPAAANGQHGEAALAVSYEVATRSSSRLQLAAVYLTGDGAKGFQVAGRSTKNVIRPALAADGQSQLHLAWLELAGFRRYRVFYASTSQAARTALGRFGSDDLVNAAYAVTWALMQGVSMFPIGLVWLAVPLAWVIGYYLVKVEGGLERRGPRIALGIAIGLYFLCKFFLLPAGFIGAAPFLDRLPPAIADVYMLALPLAVFAVALGALRVYIRRAEGATLLFGYLLFGSVDALLTLLLYAPGALG